MSKRRNPLVFLDISIDGGRADRMTFELFSDVVPKTAENFRALCTGERGLGESTKKPLHFKGSEFHRIVKGFMAQGGDLSRGDGSGGESIYGRKFPDENFKLKHDGPGILSMANSGPNSNGSQFFITFKDVPHLNGKHVVFGKVVNGLDLLKKLERVGSENGKPIRQVKISDCGEVPDSKTRIRPGGEKEKKLRRSEGGAEKVKEKRPASNNKRIKKRKHASSDSDSYSSDSSDSQSYSSDSASDSESYSSSDTSSSSDYRHKRRRKGSKRDNRKSGKRKKNHKKSKRLSKRTSRKSKWSSGSSSDDSRSSNTSSSSSDPENGARRTNHSLQKAVQEKPASTMVDEDMSAKDAREDKQRVTASNISHDRSKLPEKTGLQGNDNEMDARSGKTANRNSEDKSSKFREIPDSSSRRSPVRAVGNVLTQMTDGASGAHATDPKNAQANRPRPSTEGIPPSDKPELNHSKDLQRDSSPSGNPQRIRKGRGFTQQYAFARRYRTPSAERSPVRSQYYTGRNERPNYFNRYGRNRPYNARSPVRRYGRSPRGSSPSRYPRRERSRSRSRSPVRGHGRGGYRRQSPRRSRSPMEPPKRDVSNRPQSTRGSGSDTGAHGSSPPADRGRSRSRGRGPLTSRSPEPAPIKKESTRYNRRRRSSSRSSSPAGSKGLVSY